MTGSGALQTSAGHRNHGGIVLGFVHGGAADLDCVRRDLAAAFAPWLTRQDQAPFRPQIKAEADDARLLLERLQMEFEPFHIVAEGLLLWRYLGGPWSLVERFEFEAPQSRGVGLRRPWSIAAGGETNVRPGDRPLIAKVTQSLHGSAAERLSAPGVREDFRLAERIRLFAGY